MVLPLNERTDMISGRRFPVKVDYGRPLEKAIFSAGLDYVDATINEENFALGQAGKMSANVRFVRSDSLMTAQNVLTVIEEADMKPVDITTLVALSEQHPELQRQFPIVGLGSIWSSNIDRVPVLWGGPNGRSLFLLWTEYYWVPSFRFAAIPN